jgi:hypothetical protein
LAQFVNYRDHIAIATDLQPFQTLSLIINWHAGHKTTWFKYSALLRKQVKGQHNLVHACDINQEQVVDFFQFLRVY